MQSPVPIFVPHTSLWLGPDGEFSYDVGPPQAMGTPQQRSKRHLRSSYSDSPLPSRRHEKPARSPSISHMNCRAYRGKNFPDLTQELTLEPASAVLVRPSGQ
ncbi:uncharacterized protein EAE97_007991 [Botrytis byssoidea]|uniref:Uncharacterized protein n=1 Tax=Botrytis byssoidea TaxID=139641 RepID=A0A9P5M242_9HELO|nr:uncharacterized protein EAE97_007991 [Botrytis byssoidea]KAF7936625.1 hypothetical protein EAE97_007991 [Botrytis byssoidea]